MPTSWIYLLKRPDLEAEAEDRGIPTEGRTVEQIRKLLAEAVKSADGFETPEDAQSVEMATEDNKGKANRLGKLIKEWDLSFETTDNAVEFIERLEELVESSGIEKEDVLPALPRILRGRALLWYRNNSDSWDSWEKFLELFKLYYYPSNYEEDLIVRIVARKQRLNESFRDYLTDLQTLMRRYGSLTEGEKLHRIQENMRSEYKLYIKRQDYKDLGALLKLAADFENITPTPYRGRDAGYREPYANERQTEQWKQPTTGHGGPSRPFYSPPEREAKYSDATDSNIVKIHPRYDSRTCCWACGKPGHDARECRSRKVLFCSGCGRVGVLSKNCCRTEVWGKRESLGAIESCDREDNRNYVNAVIMGTKYQCLVDTGSTNTYVNEEIYEECKRNGAVEILKPRGVRLESGFHKSAQAI